MTDRPFITPQDISLLARPCYADEAKALAYIFEAEQNNIKPKIGDDLFLRLKDGENALLLDGGTYEKNGKRYQLNGIKKALAYYAYSRLLESGSVDLTRQGVVNRRSDAANAADEDNIIKISRETYAIADRYMQEVMDYLGAGEQQTTQRTSVRLIGASEGASRSRSRLQQTSLGAIDPNKYATKEYVDGKIAALDFPEVGDFETKEDAEKKLEAAKRYTDEAVGNIEIPELPTLAKVAESGDYNDLANKPTIPSVEGLASETYVNEKVNAVKVPKALSELTQDATHRIVTDTEKAQWNAKSNFSGDYNDLKNKPNIPSLDGYATELWVSQEIGKIDIPSVDGLASEAYVDGKIDETKDFVREQVEGIEIPSLDGYATETYVDNKVKDINVPTALSELKDDATHRLVTDTEKNTWNNKSDFDGDYNKLTNKPNIPAAVTESTVSGWGFTKNTGDYSKPSSGIPKSDLASDVQTSLGKANTALQEEQYKGTVTGVKINGTTKNPSNGVVDLGTVITAHQDISGKQDNLVSGTNIKTINGESILGKGNINISGIKWSILKKPVPTVGDIVYMANGSLKFKSPSRWDNSLGTPVGIIMIEEGYAPDGKIRILSLDVLDGYQWGPTQESPFDPDINSPLPDYEEIVLYLNNGDEHGTGEGHVMPSDIFTGEQAYGDPLAFYPEYADLTYGAVPSPYFNGKLHPAYTKVTEWGNALSDFNGLSNTQILVNAGSEYEAANACLNYKDAANSNLQWYLPAMGELCFLMARLGAIDKSLKIIGKNPIFEEDNFRFLWSSTEQNFISGLVLGGSSAWGFIPSEGRIDYSSKGNYGADSRPIAMIDSF